MNVFVCGVNGIVVIGVGANVAILLLKVMLHVYFGVANYVRIEMKLEVNIVYLLNHLAEYDIKQENIKNRVTST